MSKPAILCVDDEPEVLRSVARDLRRRYGEDYRILRADSGDAALEALRELRARGDTVALILSDQRMPKIDGAMLLDQSRELFPDAKRALLTAYADTQAAIKAINASKVHYYLLKPWDPPEEKLYPVLDDLLDEWRSAYRPGYGGMRVIGSRWAAETHAVKDFLARNQVPYRFIDVETSPEAKEFVPEGAGLPVVVSTEGERLEQATPTTVANFIGMSQQASKPFYDLAIVGAGPAGLAAAVYGASEGLKTILIDQEAPGGQAGTSSRIENYLGFPAGLSGSDLARRALSQAQKFGVELLTPQQVCGLRVDGPYRYLDLRDGSEISCHTIMLSTGVSWRRLPAEGAEAFTGRGIYYGAAMSEAMNAQDEDVYIVGAGNSAGQAAMYFAQYARKVIMLVRGDDLGAKMSHYLVEQIGAVDNIEVRLNTEVKACRGDERLEHLTLYNNATDESYDTGAHMLFIFIGAAPRTDWLGDTVARDKRGFILTGPDIPETALRDWPLERTPFLLETSVPGVFAAGDVRHESVKRVASAVGEGSVSVASMHQHLASL